MREKARWLGAIALLVSVGCGPRPIAIVQQHHGRELRCDGRYVHVEHDEGERWISRGCGFEAEWDCRAGECSLIDLRAHGMNAP